MGQEKPIRPFFADIETLNHIALHRTFPLIKISLAAYPLIEKEYELLSVGMTLGQGVGPKVVAKNSQFPSRIAIPGRHTTAHALFSLFFPSPIQKHFCPYNQVEELINTNVVDGGILIHESRFTFQERGLVELADLGELWNQRFHLPLPLGALAIKRGEDKNATASILQDSLSYAYSHFDEAIDFVLSYCQEKNRALIERYLALYVTDETKQLSPLGEKAVETFLNETHSLCHLSGS